MCSSCSPNLNCDMYILLHHMPPYAWKHLWQTWQPWLGSRTFELGFVGVSLPGWLDRALCFLSAPPSSTTPVCWAWAPTQVPRGPKARGKHAGDRHGIYSHTWLLAGLLWSFQGLHAWGKGGELLHAADTGCHVLWNLAPHDWQWQVKNFCSMGADMRNCHAFVLMWTNL